MVEIQVFSKPKQKVRQPAADWLPSTPFLMGASGPSMSGKGVLIQNIIHTEQGDPVFDGTQYWVGRTQLDANTQGLKRWTEDVLKQDPNKNPAMHDGFQPEDVMGGASRG